MATLITGATGTIGRRLAARLAARGDELVALVRPGSDEDVLGDLELDLVEGDITDPEDVAEAMSGCERVFHLAGAFSEWLADEREFFDVNTGGTVNVLNAASAAGIEKMVHVSSASAIGQPQFEIGDEDTVHRGSFLTTYERSKWEAEQFVMEEAEGGLPVTIVCPAMVYGPGDLRHNGRRLVSLLSGRPVATLSTDSAYVFIDDVVEGIIAADERGRAGERYILSGGNMTREEFLVAALDVAGVKGNLQRVSAWQLRMLQYMDSIRRIFKPKDAPVVTKEGIDFALFGHSFDARKARQELEIEFTDVEDGLDETIEWLYQEGMIDLPDDVLPEDDDDADESPNGESVV